MFKEKWFWALFGIILAASLAVGIVLQPRLHIGLGWWMVGAWPVAVVASILTALVTDSQMRDVRRLLSEMPITGYVGLVLAPYVGLLASSLYFALTGGVVASLFLFGLSFVTCRWLHGRPMFPIL